MEFYCSCGRGVTAQQEAEAGLITTMRGGVCLILQKDKVHIDIILDQTLDYSEGGGVILRGGLLALRS